MNRRKFLRTAALGSAALGALPTLANSLTTPAWAGHNQTNFDFVSNSFAATIDGVVNRMLMNGNGKVTPSQVGGGGSFVHFDSAPAAPIPKPILASGTWKAKQLLSFELIGTYGSVAAGIVEMEIHLVVDFPSPAVIPATLEIVCNLGIAGLVTGEEEGFILTIPDAPFGPFMPVTPPAGITIFTIGNKKRD
jgi:hypothetical protein